MNVSEPAPRSKVTEELRNCVRRVRPKVVYTPLSRDKDDKRAKAKQDPFVRAENEDDDGYDPYSDRPAEPEGLEPDPWR